MTSSRLDKCAVAWPARAFFLALICTHVWGCSIFSSSKGPSADEPLLDALRATIESLRDDGLCSGECASRIDPRILDPDNASHYDAEGVIEPPADELSLRARLIESAGFGLGSVARMAGCQGSSLYPLIPDLEERRRSRDSAAVMVERCRELEGETHLIASRIEDRDSARVIYVVAVNQDLYSLREVSLAADGSIRSVRVIEQYMK